MVVMIYNRPARIEKRFEQRALVRWLDNGTQGVVFTSDIEEVA